MAHLSTYARTIRSKADKNIYLDCDLGVYHDRVNAPEGTKRRWITTRRIGCPFRLYGKRILGDKWELQVQNPSHNHTADDSMIGHPAARKLTEEQLQNILQMSEIGSRPRDILAMVRRQYPDSLVSSRDIYNARSALRRQKLGNDTPLGFLQTALQESSWKYALKQDSEAMFLFYVCTSRVNQICYYI